MRAGAGVTTKKQTFTAASSAAGYYYQARLALFESLRLAYGEFSIDVAIERFDDVSFEKDGEPIEVKCHFCNTAYRFSVEDLVQIRQLQE